MIDPETARQAEEAVAEWNAALLIRGTQSDITNLLCRAGGALAVLVPQLLDRISGLEQLNEELVGEIHRLLDVQRAKRSFGG